MHIQFTNVDARTGIAITQAPAENGPAFPDIPGLQVAFANESAWPCTVPLYWGHCDDGADHTTQGVLAVLTPEQFVAAQQQELQARTERLAQEAREQRAQLLAASDWTQMPDTPMTESQRSAWQDYRQRLRDITAQPGWPQTIEWPAQP